MSGADPQKGKIDVSGKEQGETGACRKRRDVCVCVRVCARACYVSSVVSDSLQPYGL